MPKASLRIFATGPRQLVVHDAFEITSCWSASYASSFTPSTSVTSGSLAGAEMITFLAPASRCLAASSRLVKSPVDSTTTSAPTSAHGRAAGSRSENTRSSLPSMMRPLSLASTSPGKGPRIESYLSRWASVSLSVMSLTPTQSMSAGVVLPEEGSPRSARACAARNTLRPMRPKPLMPALRAIRDSLSVASRWAAESTGAVTRLGAPGRLVDVAVHDVDEHVGASRVVAGQVVGHDHGAVTAARAADGHRQVGLALLLVGGQQVVEQRHQPLVEVGYAIGALDVVHDRLVPAGELAQLGLVVGVRKEAHIEAEVGVARGAVLEAEGEEGDGQLAGALVGQHLVRHHLAEPSGREVTGVDRHAGTLLERLQPLALEADCVLHRAAASERVAAAGLLEAVDQDAVRGLQVEQPEGNAARGQLVENLHEALEVLAAANVGSHRGALDLAALVAEELRQRADHLGRQVVDAEVAGVLESGHRLRLARAGEAGDDHEVLDHLRALSGLVDVGVNPASDLARQARHRLQLFAVGLQEALRRAEVLKDLPLARGSDSRQLVEYRAGHRAVATAAVEFDREAVRLVAHPLEQLQLR